MLRLFFQRYNFTSFKGFTDTLLEIQRQPGRNQKQRIFHNYIQGLADEQKLTIRGLFELCFVKFSRIDDKSLINNCQLLGIDPVSLQLSLQKENDILNAISILHSTKTLNPLLQVKELYSQFLSIKETVGNNSRDRKFKIINSLLFRCRDQSQKRTVLAFLTNNLQIGFSKIMISQTFQSIIPTLKEQGQHRYQCMLTKPLKSFQQALKFIKDDSVAIEYKFDGQRTHIQYARNADLKLYSRQGKTQEVNYPDIFPFINEQLRRIQDLNSCILDGEIVCVDQKGNATNIQVLLNRKSKSRQNLDTQYSEKVMVFDILEKNGRSLIQLPYKERIKHIPNFNDCLILTNVDRCVFKLPEQIDNFTRFFEETVKLGYEGLVLKKLNSQYDIKRGRVNWAKLKQGQTEEGTAGRSVDVDLIMMGASRGKGNRKGVLGSFLFGAMHDGKIYPITKTGTTLTDQVFKQVSQEVLKYSSQQIPLQYVIPKGMPKPDIWVKPHFVVEISSQQWTRSPVYSFNQNSEGGLSLRFPRFIRIRYDKSIKESTQGHQILQLIS